MPVTFDELILLRSSNLGLSAALVLAHCRENGRMPVETVAEACQLSERSIYRALSGLEDLERQGVLEC